MKETYEHDQIATEYGRFNREPIAEKIGDLYMDVEIEIERMIAKYEFPLYQRDKLKNIKWIDIDFEAISKITSPLPIRIKRIPETFGCFGDFLFRQ